MKYPLLSLCLLAICLPALAQEHKSYPASPFPDRVILGWKGDPAHSQAVNWRTDSTITEGIAAIHEADASPDFQAHAKIIKAQNLPTTIEGKSVMNHEVNFTDLKPATQYVYRVGDGKYWSEWFHFTTASDKADPVSFIYFGDAQNDLRSMWSRTIRGAFSNVPKANFIVHAGDLINRANADNEWGEWFEAGGWINGMIPSLSTPGNHEYYRDDQKKAFVSQQWRPQFALPENGPSGFTETAYHIDYQGIKLISIDSQGAMLDSMSMLNQAKWMEAVLKENTNKWTVVFHHHPIYSTKNGRDNDDWREIMEPLYKKYGVDIVLQGHDHTYGRGINMPEGQSRKKPDGPIYVVSVSGPKMYDIGLQNWMDRAASNTQLYQIIDIANDKLSYKAFTVTGELYDNFELTKDKKGVNTLIEKEHTLQMKERLELPARLQKQFKDAELQEYNERFKAYKKRKGLK
ncbi:calcineurin-like phosphoesterase family protein [Dyadobacter jejuensis]|uniref:Calcineurin-like phosphoesterase family protein n=1 Tax=Dyadobacter jejuensis TaxID=1082580 RepID=A0A316AP98_9BACT|nr:metallophosphoesterase family protein [Dyadobacter jejuensis]PWJ59321.1 calcineurin-like phosphoesterase family protein [Dyadobacter jejuensis]